METASAFFVGIFILHWSSVFFSFGFLLGRSRKDRRMLKLYMEADRRGNYWHDKYMSLADEDWRPMYDESYIDEEDTIT